MTLLARSRRYLLVSALAVAAGITAVHAAKREAPVKPAVLTEPYSEPLQYKGEFVEVTNANTLRMRYASPDFAKDLAFYTERAKAASAGQKHGTIHIREVFITHIDIVARHAGNPGGKIEATCEIPKHFITEAPEYEKMLANTFFAYSNGALQIEWGKPIVIDKPIQYDQPMDNAGQWWFHPKPIENELKPYLSDIKPGDTDYLMFFLDVAKAKDGKQLWPSYGGMAWGGETINGARLLTINDHEVARGTHEMGHHLYDSVAPEVENMTVTRFHGMTDAGYYGDEIFHQEKIGTLPLGPIMMYYRDCMRYYYPRDMWERWKMTGKQTDTHEPFTGKTYAWSDVKNDYWFKLPWLHDAELRELTGLKTLNIEAGEAWAKFTVDDSEKLESPVLTGPIAEDWALNNALNLRTESAAVLKTAKGTFLIVRPPVADLWVDKDSFHDANGKPTPVVGYVLVDDKGFIVLKTDDPTLPLDEYGFFHPPVITVTAEGLIDQHDTAFAKTLSLTVRQTDPAVKSMHFTIDNTVPSEKSPTCDGKIELTDSAVVRIAAFDASNKRLGGDFRGAYRLEPMTVAVGGVATMKPRPLFGKEATITPTPTIDGVTMHYTIDDSEPTASSPAVDKPIVITDDATVAIRCFDSTGKARGEPWKRTFSHKGFEENLTTGKPVTTEGAAQGADSPTKAVDGLANIEDGWWGAGGPQSLTVDLQDVHNLDHATVFTYYDGGRYYQWTLQTSTDGKKWDMASDQSKNTEPSTADGQKVTFAARQARYVRLNMQFNSNNPAMHVLELRVYEPAK